METTPFVAWLGRFSYSACVADQKTTLLTARDYQASPGEVPRHQLVQGELVMAPAPNRYHQDILRNIGFLLLKHLEAHHAGAIYFAPFDVYLTEHDVYQPDLVYVSNERREILQDDGARGAPNLVIEILSAGTAFLDRGIKKQVYAASGVEELWLIDPFRNR